MAPSWRWLLVAVAAAALSFFGPGSMLVPPVAVSHATSIEAALPDPGAAGCAAASCNRGSPAATGSVPTVAVISMLVVAGVALALTRTWRRTRAATFVLPSGSPLTLFRPPQRAQHA